MIAVQSNIPTPPTTERRGRPAVYPFKSLAVGDSFFVAGKITQNLSPSVKHFTHKLGWRFTCNERIEDGVQGVRVWRVE